MPTKKAICPQTRKPHKWRLDSKIKHADISKTGRMINFHYQCADCPAKHVFRNLLDR